MTRSLRRTAALLAASPLLLPILVPSAAWAEEDLTSEGVRITVVIEPLESGGGGLSPTGLEPSAGVVGIAVVLVATGLTLLLARRRARLSTRHNP